MASEVMRRRIARCFPEPVRWAWHRLRQRWNVLKDIGLGNFIFKNWLEFRVNVRRRVRQRNYRILREAELIARRRSDTVFILGSGYSLNDVTEQEWEHIGRHDVMGFSGAIYQRWVPVGFHLIRGWDYGVGRQYMNRWRKTWHVSAQEYACQLCRNSQFDGAALIMQSGYAASFSNILLAYGMIPAYREIFLYKTSRRLDKLPSERLSDGLSHGTGTLFDAINLAYLLGWKKIVLLGVDLYDCRYFWGPPDKTMAFDNTGRLVVSEFTDKGRLFSASHGGVSSGVVDHVGRWAEYFNKKGVALEVYNPRSLLARVIPICMMIHCESRMSFQASQFPRRAYE